MILKKKCFQRAIYLICIILLCGVLLYYSNFKLSNVSYVANASNVNTNTTQPDVLLIYVYADSNQYAFGNLEYFINTAVRGTDPVDYYFILQQKNNTNLDTSKFPKLPSNAHYIHHENKCFDYGTMGWFLSTFTTGNPYSNEILGKETKKINLRAYKYFIFMNSSTRGPYFPPYYFTLVSLYASTLGKKLYWYSIFTERITETVKLVGPTISCEVSPHIQVYIAATDFIGLSVLLKSDGKTGVFDCYDSMWNDIIYSEVGSSTRMLAAGYSIDSLLTKYQGLDFTASRNRQCNGRANPHINNGIDGISFDPYEIVFVKFNYKRNDGIVADRATIYQKWVKDLENNTARHY